MEPWALQVPVLSLFPCRADGSVGQAGPSGASQQHSPAHTGSVTSVAALKPDLCVSGGRDKVRYPPLGQENISTASKIRLKCELWTFPWMVAGLVPGFRKEK